MNTAPAIWAVREEASALAHYVAEHLGGETFIALPSNRVVFAERFCLHSQWIFIGAVGIAVRYLNGLTRDKRADPAVVVLDEAGRFAIALLGGHEAGANELAHRVANLTGATPVITTATEALKPLVLGIGCRKNVSVEQIGAAVEGALQLVSRQIGEVREVATIDVKQDEPALIEWCGAKQIPLRIIACEEVAERAWITQPSAWVRENIGVEGVCEPCALIASPRGRLLLPKTARDGVTVALVEDAPFIRRCHPERSLAKQNAVEGSHEPHSSSDALETPAGSFDSALTRSAQDDRRV
jgi:cobalt-precorrin 5A hydrolase